MATLTRRWRPSTSPPFVFVVRRVLAQAPGSPRRRSRASGRCHRDLPRSRLLLDRPAGALQLRAGRRALHPHQANAPAPERHGRLDRFHHDDPRGRCKPPRPAGRVEQGRAVRGYGVGCLKRQPLVPHTLTPPYPGAPVSSPPPTARRPLPDLRRPRCDSMRRGGPQRAESGGRTCRSCLAGRSPD